MNTKTQGIGNTAGQADSVDSQRDQASFVVELGTVTNETRQNAPPVAIDSQLIFGTLGS